MTESQEINTVKKNPIIVDDDKNTHLHHTAALGYEDNVIMDLSTEPKFDVENYLGWTPLMMACRNGHLNVVKLLLEHRADATKKNKFGMSVFLVSIASGNLEIVMMILQHLLCGGVSKQSMQNFFSPVALAALFSHQEILIYLLMQNFNKNSVTLTTGITPLMFAAAMEDNDSYTILLRNGADPSLKSYLGYTAQEILQAKTKKINVFMGEVKQPQLPMTILPPQEFTHTAHMETQDGVQYTQQYQHQIPYIVISPQPSFFQIPPNPVVNNIRKSSNSFSPSPKYYLTTSNISPITPLNFLTQPQLFFPSDFSPNQFYTNSPIPYVCNNSNDFLNARMNQSNMYLSPNPQLVNGPLPCDM